MSISRISSSPVGNLRHRARAAALQALYELELTNHPLADVVERIGSEELMTPEGRAFFKRLVEGAWANRTAIDAHITRLAPSWPLHQMPGVDTAVLRIALFEIIYDTAADKAPANAVINEAVELAKHYGSDSSGRFINGVLSTVVNNPDDHSA